MTIQYLAVAKYVFLQGSRISPVGGVNETRTPTMTTRLLLLLLSLISCPTVAFSTFAGAKSTSNLGGTAFTAHSYQSKLFVRGGTQEEDVVVVESPVDEEATPPSVERIIEAAHEADHHPPASFLSAVTVPMLSSLAAFGKA